MVRQVQVQVPLMHSDTVLATLKKHPDVISLSRFRGDFNILIIFKCFEKKSSSIFAALAEVGVGERFGCIDIIELQSTIPILRKREPPTGKKRTYNSYTDRLSIEEIYQAVESQIHLTFNYIALLIVAAMIAGIGLIQNSDATVVASMLVSPLMSPIMGLTFGTCIKDKHMVSTSLRNEIIGVVITFVMGVIIGLVVCPFYTLGVKWPTDEMSSRGSPLSLVLGACIAIPSGAGVAIAITGAISSTVVGVAISAALLPPIVCSGMNVAFGVFQLLIAKASTNDFNAGYQALWIALYSFLLFIVNFVLIYVVAMAFFRLKSIRPLASTRGNVGISDEDELAINLTGSVSSFGQKYMRDPLRDPNDIRLVSQFGQGKVIDVMDHSASFGGMEVAREDEPLL
mmetsp:Transcript_33673/g.84537  ORF Transcript_33673/g.84537 Transcript_33673/m.84537 type:complete len:399 (-) Transcript_33673:149-1345(-)|eukprot:CAMPEP_0177657220 /NCGR_PEP_ID=MMETSP0447-20121125/16059_1 /TAXON_ID=0 /ORGANISM="Stygamoeba regulata, Strain BSH-02190019" /LENGTH=398 /DNA_ID=CAMNT_0019161541 /DNA_START=22 /DNA_END=1218 /DNA_ORIENTATION=-